MRKMGGGRGGNRPVQGFYKASKIETFEGACGISKARVALSPWSEDGILAEVVKKCWAWAEDWQQAVGGWKTVRASQPPIVCAVVNY